MKYNIHNLLIVIFLLFFTLACEQSEHIYPLSETTETSLDVTTNEGIILTTPDPLCRIVGPDWDGLKMEVGERRTFCVEALGGAVYNWSYGNSNIKIIGSNTSSCVTIEAVRSGSASLTAQRSINGGGSCSNTGNITVCTVPTNVNIRQVSEVCVGDFVSFRASVPSNSCHGTFIWTSSGDGDIVTNPDGNATVTAETSGSNFTVTATYYMNGNAVASRSWRTIFATGGCFGGELEF